MAATAPVGDPRAKARRLRPSALAMLVALAAALQLGLVPVPAMLDAISLGMIVLALGCATATWIATPSQGAAQRWRWRAALAGWVLWIAQWGANTVVDWLVAGEQFVPNALVTLSRVAFIVALTPLAGPGEPRTLRWFDAALGGLFASLLALLSWPGIESGATLMPDRLYLYFGYGAMAALAGMSLATQRGRALRAFSRAMLVTFLLYGGAAIGLREAFTADRIASQSAWFLLGDLAFVAFMLLLPWDDREPRPVDAAPVAESGAPVAESGAPVAESGAPAQGLVPLLLALLVVGLAFAAVPVSPAIGIAAGAAALLVYASRAMLTDGHHRRMQDRAIAIERARAGTMIDFMHELRSPLGVVALNAGLLRRTGTPTPDQLAICHSIETGCASVGRLLDDMLSLERLEAGLDPPVLARHDLAAVAREVVMLLEARWREAGVEVIGPTGALSATADRQSVHRILLNLVDNAIRFTPPGGRVTITLARRPDAAVLAVTDEGVGMDARQQARLFERFATVGRPLNGRRGSGLGLSISMALARAMGGHIAVLSQPGRGTTMRLVLLQSGTAPDDYTRV